MSMTPTESATQPTCQYLLCRSSGNSSKHSRKKKAPGDAGAFVCAETRGSVIRDHRAAAELVVQANPGNVAIEAGSRARRNRCDPQTSKAGRAEVNSVTTGRVTR